MRGWHAGELEAVARRGVVAHHAVAVEDAIDHPLTSADGCIAFGRLTT
jgi:hypothetical protein